MYIWHRWPAYFRGRLRLMWELSPPHGAQLPAALLRGMVQPISPVRRIVAVVIIHHQELLLVRGLQNAPRGNAWVMPRVEVELGESGAQAISRWLGNNVGMIVTGVGGTLFRAQDPGSRAAVDYVPVVAVGDPIPSKWLGTTWVRVQKAEAFALVPSDRVFVRRLLARRPSWIEWTA